MPSEGEALRQYIHTLRLDRRESKNFNRKLQQDHILLSDLKSNKASALWRRTFPASYKYDPLPKGHWIRLLVLQPGTLNDPIQCHLVPISLQKASNTYYALSYVWGPETPQYHVSIDNRGFQIRGNLYRFLLALRSKRHAKLLWADAMCINQASIKEKNHQVQMMKEVYSNSISSLVWLGFTDDAGTELLDHAYYKKDHWDINTSVPDATLLKAFTVILHCEYWKRLWIIQEVVLPSNVFVCILHRRVPWPDFVDICRRTMMHLMPRNPRIAERYSDSTFSELCQQRSSTEPQHLPVLIKEFCESSCFDPRDRIYGLLGLAKEVSIQVDYTMSPLKLFAQVAPYYYVYDGFIIESLLKALNIMAYLQLTSSSGYCYQMPINFKGPYSLSSPNSTTVRRLRAERKSILEDDPSIPDMQDGYYVIRGRDKESHARLPLFDVLLEIPFLSTSGRSERSMQRVMAMTTSDHSNEPDERRRVVVFNRERCQLYVVLVAESSHFHRRHVHVNIRNAGFWEILAAACERGSLDEVMREKN